MVRAWSDSSPSLGPRPLCFLDLNMNAEHQITKALAKLVASSSNPEAAAGRKQGHRQRASKSTSKR
jgi:hypothetical protein